MFATERLCSDAKSSGVIPAKAMSSGVIAAKANSQRALSHAAIPRRCDVGSRGWQKAAPEEFLLQQIVPVRTKAPANAEACEERMMKPSQRANASARSSLGSSTGCWMPRRQQLRKLKCGLQTGPDFNR